MRPLGHRTYLAAKAKGDNSMFGKAGSDETTKSLAGRDPDGMVKARLLEPKCPLCISTGLDTVGNIQRSHEPSCDCRLERRDEVVVLLPNTLRGIRVAVSNLKDTNWAPTAVLNVTQARTAGSPKG